MDETDVYGLRDWSPIMPLRDWSPNIPLRDWSPIIPFAMRRKLSSPVGRLNTSNKITIKKQSVVKSLKK